MPRAFDRAQTPFPDKDPTRSSLDWTDPQGAIADSSLQAAQTIRENLPRILKDLTGIDFTGVFEFMDWISEQVGLVMTGFGEVWQNLLDGITEIFTPLGENLEAAWNDAVAAINGIFSTARDASTAADQANISVQALKAALAGGGSDEFDYGNAATLPESTYSVSYSGAGAGTYGPNGSGLLVWKASGAGAREVLYRRTDKQLIEDNGVVTVVWAARPFDALFPQTYGYICGRMSNTATSTHIRAKIGNTEARIQAVVSGTVYNIGSAASITVKNGDVFELWYGDADEPYRILLKQNGVTVLDRTDTGEVSEIGESYRSIGFGAQVENYLLVTQNPAPSLAGWTWSLQPTEGS
jgi:hypothetical protein